MRPSFSRYLRAPPPRPSPTAAAPLRPFSSTASTSFFFNRPPPATPKKLLDELVDARKADRLDLVTKIYPSLVDAIRSSPHSREGLSHARLQSVMRFVATTSRFNLLLKMFNDLPSFGFEPDAMDHQLLLQGMGRSGKLSKALKWIEAMESTHGVRPSVADWNVVLGGYRRARDAEGMKEVVESMKARGVELNVVTYNTLISALFENGDVEGVRRIRREMDAAGVEADVWTETALLTGFVDAGELASASEVRRRLVPKDARDAPKLDTPAVNALIKLESAEKGFLAGMRMAGRYRDRGFRLDAWTLNTLAGEGAKGLHNALEGTALVEEMEEMTGLAADRRAWTIVVGGVLRGEGGIDEALKIYQEARDRSIKPDSSMVQPLLSALLEPFPTSATFATAKSLYEDLATSSREHNLSPDTSIYVTLLRACANPSHPDLEYSRTLLADMRERRVRLEAPTVTWHIVALMRASSNFEDAFQAYDTIRALDVPALDQASYNTILAAFTSLSFPSPSSSRALLAPAAPPTMILEFLSDMRRASHPPDSITYSLLLRYYSRTASASVSTISHIHSLIKLDIHLDPDVALFNSLMNAYARVGAFGPAYRIWDSMRANRGGPSVDRVSVSIVLDSCGWQGGDVASQRARRIWDELRDEGFELNLKNWESWVECLCRVGDFGEAERVVFEEMGKGSEVPATVSTFETLIKLARREKGRWASVRARVEKERPELWEELREVAATEVMQNEEEKARREVQVEVESIARY